MGNLGPQKYIPRVCGGTHLIARGEKRLASEGKVTALTLHRLPSLEPWGLPTTTLTF